MFDKPQPFPKPLTELGYLSFTEERLELGYDYGVVGGPAFKTDIAEVADDREQRNIPRCLPLGRWQLGDRLIADSEIDKLEEVIYLKKFHLNRLGAFQGFRFKDWSDYRAINQYIFTGDGIKTEFQLRKAYKAGNAVTYRPIQKPVVGTVDIFVDGVNVAVDPNHEWVVNHETGVLSNPVALANGAVLTANFEFDLPVWFETDQIGFRLEAHEPKLERSLYRLESLFVVENRIPLALPWEIEPLPEITEDLDLGIVYETVEQYQFATDKLAVASGYTRRESKREDTKILFKLGNRNYDQAEVDTILGYFYCARGKAVEFPFVNLGKNFKVRFDQDQLNFKFEAASDNDALFSLSGLKLQIKEQILFRLPPFSIAFDPIIINPQDPEDPIILDSNPPDILSNQGNLLPNKKPKKFSISTFSASETMVNVGSIAELELESNAAHLIKTAFWSAGQLHVFVTGNYGSFHNRLIYYRLNPGSIWTLEFFDNGLYNYYNHGRGIKILKTPTGVSLFVAATPSPVNSELPINNQTAGLLRFEIRDDGSQLIDFIPNSSLTQGRLVTPYALFGNKVFIQDNYADFNFNEKVISSQGLEYYSGYFSLGYNNGFPLANKTYNNDFPTHQTLVNNVWLDSNSNLTSYYENVFQPDLFLTTNSYNNSQKRYIRYADQNQQGNIFLKFFSEKECLGESCTFAEGKDYFRFYLKESVDKQGQIIDWQNLASFSDIGTYGIQFPSSDPEKYIFDQYGNILNVISGSIFFYRAGSGYGIEITSQLNLPGTIGGIRTLRALTPYGFCILYHLGDLWGDNPQNKIIFVQPK